ERPAHRRELDRLDAANERLRSTATQQEPPRDERREDDRPEDRERPIGEEVSSAEREHDDDSEREQRKYEPCHEQAEPGYASLEKAVLVLPMLRGRVHEALKSNRRADPKGARSRDPLSTRPTPIKRSDSQRQAMPCFFSLSMIVTRLTPNL